VVLLPVSFQSGTDAHRICHVQGTLRIMSVALFLRCCPKTIINIFSFPLRARRDSQRQPPRRYADHRASHRIAVATFLGIKPTKRDQMCDGVGADHEADAERVLTSKPAEAPHAVGAAGARICARNTLISYLAVTCHSGSRKFRQNSGRNFSQKMCGTARVLAYEVAAIFDRGRPPKPGADGGG
jgi:hypothetical protein